MYQITLTFNVKKIRTAQDAEAFAQDLVTHIFEIYNDDNSISQEVWFNTKKVRAKS